MLNSIVRNLWPVFLGIGFIMLGNGLQGTLTSWRATYEGFTPTTTGLIMTAYYIGFLVGSKITPYFVKNVGHIRLFAAYASMVSAAVLIQVLFVSPATWFFMRLITGVCFAGVYVITESWLNARSTNETRGSILSFYMVISFASLSSGQWLMNIADPADVQLFILASILLSFALVPVLMTRMQAPQIETEESISIKEVFATAPAGAIALFISSTAHSAMFAMGAVFAVKAGMAVTQVALFMSTFIAFGALAQWPLGWLSDQIDRRLVILACSVAVTFLCILLPMFSVNGTLFIILFGLLAAATLPIYSISVAHTNDRLPPEKMTAASSTLVLLSGIGSIAGPLMVGLLLTHIGTSGFFIHIGLVHLLLAVLTLYFIMEREAVAEEDQTQYQAIPPRATMVAMEAVAHEAEELQFAEEDNG